MSKNRLILSSIKKQYQIYLMYFISLVSSLSILLTYLNVSTSMINAIDITDKQFKILIVTIYVVGLLIVAIIIYLINYIQTLVIEMKSKELAIYRLFSFDKKKIYYLLLTEQLIINTVTFLCAMVISIMITIILIDNFNKAINLILGITVEVFFSHYLILFEFVIFFLISSVISYITTKKIMKKEIIELLDNASVKPYQVKKKSTNTLLFFLMTSGVILIYVLLKQFNHLNIMTVILLVLMYIIIIIFLFDELIKVVLKLIPKNIYYYRTNSFVFSIVTRSLQKNRKLMVIISILFIICTFAITFGIVSTKLILLEKMENDVSIVAMYNTIPIRFEQKNYTIEYYNNRTDENLNFNIGDGSSADNVEVISEYTYNQFAKENKFNQVDIAKEKALVITNDKTYNVGEQLYERKTNIELEIEKVIPITNKETKIIIVVDNTLNADVTEKIMKLHKELEEKNLNPRVINFKQGNLNLLRNNQVIMNRVNVTSQTIANEYLSLLKIDEEFHLKSGEIGYFGNLEYSNNDELTIEGMGKQYILEKTIINENLKELNQGIFVLNDYEYSQYYNDYSLQIIYLDYQDEYNEDYWKNLSVKKLIPVNIKIKNEHNTLLILTIVIYLGSAIFMSMIILLLLMLMIGIQISIESIEMKTQFENLYRIGYKRKQIHKIINKITYIYILIPLIVAIINMLIFGKIFADYLMKHTTLAVAVSTNSISISEIIKIFILIVIIYLIHGILVNWSYKKTIDKNIDRRKNENIFNRR